MITLLSLSLAASGAAPPHPVEVPHGVTPAGAQTGGHAADSTAHEGGHEAGHHYYTADDDHDGVVNWMDSTTGSAPNTETYIGPVMIDSWPYLSFPLGYHLFNFLLLVGVVGWFVRRPLADTFRDRALKIRTEITDSARKRDEAHQRHQELVARLSKIEAEIGGMRTEAEADARREEAQLVERARREAERVREQAERNVRDETTRARTALRREAVELAVQLAEQTLRQSVGTSDHQALARDFLASVQNTTGAGSQPGAGRA